MSLNFQNALGSQVNRNSDFLVFIKRTRQIANGTQVLQSSPSILKKKECNTKMEGETPTLKRLFKVADIFHFLT